MPDSYLVVDSEAGAPHADLHAAYLRMCRDEEAPLPATRRLSDFLSELEARFPTQGPTPRIWGAGPHQVAGRCALLEVSRHAPTHVRDELRDLATRHGLSFYDPEADHA